MKIKYIFWDDDTGYGIAAKQLITSLINNGIQVLKAGLKQSQHKPTEYQKQEFHSESEVYDLVFIHTSPYYIGRHLESGKINMAYCTWETTHLPQKWVQELNKCTAVFVASSFNKKYFEQSGVTRPIHILPHISEFNGEADALPLRKIHKSDITFYSIGMWSERKNNLALMNAFSKAFSNGESVKLIIKTSKKDYTKPGFDLFKRLGYTYYFNLDRVGQVSKLVKRDTRIHLLTGKWSSEQIAQLHYSADCYISLCKSEGWGLGAYEAAWFGKPIIITGFGGQLDFLPPAYATLLPYQLINIKDQVWTEYNRESQEWANPDIDAAIQAMKEVYAHSSTYEQQGKQLKQHVSEHFNANQIVKLFIQQLQSYIAIK